MADQTAYRIAEWFDRYEVSDDGRAAKRGTKLRSGPLNFVRYKVNGHSMGAGYRRMLDVSGSSSKAEITWAVFSKLLELAADEPRELRGWILNENDEPATVEDIAFFTGFRQKSIETALRILASPRLQWLVLDPFCGSQQREADPSVETREGANPFLNETEPEPETQPNAHSTEPEPEPIANIGGSDSGETLARVTSGSSSGSSGSGELSRPVAHLKFHEAVKPLVGRNGSSRHPPDSAQSRADETCVSEWWESIWPIDGDAAESRRRFEKAMKLADRARSKDRPMAWMTRRLKQEGLL